MLFYMNNDNWKHKMSCIFTPDPVSYPAEHQGPQVMNATNDLLGHINEGFDSIGKMIEEVFETVGEL